MRRTFALATALLLVCSGSSRATVPVCTAPGTQDQFAVAAGDSFFVVAWRDNRNDLTTTFDIYAQAFDWLGNPAWSGSLGTGIPIAQQANEQNEPRVAVGPDGLAWMSWRDYRTCSASANDGEIYLQAIERDGTPLCPSGGRLVIATPSCGHHMRHSGVIAPTVGAGVVAWHRNRSITGGYWEKEVRAQKVDAGTCGLLWSGQGTLVVGHGEVFGGAGLAGDIVPLMAPDGSDGMYVVWAYPLGSSSRIYVRRVDAAGNPLWAGVVRASTENVMQASYAIAPDGLGGLLVVWEHGATGVRHVRGQRIDGTGAVQWGAAGKVIAMSSGDLRTPQIVRSILGRSFVIWEDFYSAGISDIHAQRINLLGDSLAPRIPLCQAPYAQTLPQAAPGPNGSCFVVWQDGRNIAVGDDADLYTHRIDADGNLLCAPDGEPFAALYPSRQADPKIVSVVSGGSHVSPPRGKAVVVWSDTRNGNPDLYAQAVLDSCPTIVTAVGWPPAATAGLGHSVPNPFSGWTAIPFALPAPGRVTLRVYDVAGRTVRTLLDSTEQGPGPHEISWDGRDDDGKHLGPGVYFYRLEMPGRPTLARRTVLIR